MSRIRGRDTAPERYLRSQLHGAGLRFRLRSKLPGRPDIVFPARRIAVFVHGCFWHRHRGCRFAYVPQSNVRFWQAKFAENMARDERVTRELERLGWRSLIAWECEIKCDVGAVVRRVRATATKRDATR